MADLTYLKSKYLLIGLPSSGKTTFLAALWHVIQSGDVEGSLRLRKLPENIEYLNEIRSRWQTCQELNRTVTGAEKSVSMLLENPDNRQEIELIIPDMAGESFKSQWRDRQWSISYDDIVKEAHGCLLFIHSSQIKEPKRIFNADSLVSIIDDGQTPDEENEITEWNPDDSPTQVILVDLIQFLMFKNTLQSPFPIAVILAAWDLVPYQKRNPDEWINQRLPLLSQFFKSNKDLFPSKAFGISAQGGKIPDESDSLLNHRKASDRILVECTDYQSNDISAPIKWLLENR